MMVGVCQNLFQLLLFSREKESRLIVWERRWGGRVEGLRSPREGIGYPLQYPWASLVAQLVKNLPAMWETWVWSLGLEDPLEKGKPTHSSTLAWRIPWTVHGVAKSQTQESDTTEWLSLHFTWRCSYQLSKPLSVKQYTNTILLTHQRTLLGWDFQMTSMIFPISYHSH